MTASGQRPASALAAPEWARRPANLARAITAKLVGRIVRGDHPSGTSLPPEPVLCEIFSVSRTVIREAMKVLQEKGLVQVRQGAGTLVTPSSMWNVLDELVLEEFRCRNVVERQDPENRVNHHGKQQPAQR